MPSELRVPPDAGSKRKSLSPDKENRPDGTEEATDGARSPENGVAPQDASPFAVISASMGWDTFHMVCLQNTFQYPCVLSASIIRHSPRRHIL